ncbi:MAG TPA: hypothetical protein VLA24_17980, partial [Pseudomonadales bacterium]|nr:hypothetical protein [Pseudomonadales bacterium]
MMMITDETLVDPDLDLDLDDAGAMMSDGDDELLNSIIASEFDAQYQHQHQNQNQHTTIISPQAAPVVYDTHVLWSMIMEPIPTSLASFQPLAHVGTINVMPTDGFV